MLFDSIHHVAIISSDYDKAKEFYVSELPATLKGASFQASLRTAFSIIEC